MKRSGSSDLSGGPTKKAAVDNSGDPSVSATFSQWAANNADLIKKDTSATSPAGGVPPPTSLLMNATLAAGAKLKGTSGDADSKKDHAGAKADKDSAPAAATSSLPSASGKDGDAMQIDSGSGAPSGSKSDGLNEQSKGGDESKAQVKTEDAPPPPPPNVAGLAQLPDSGLAKGNGQAPSGLSSLDMLKKQQQVGEGSQGTIQSELKVSPTMHAAAIAMAGVSADAKQQATQSQQAEQPDNTEGNDNNPAVESGKTKNEPGASGKADGEKVAAGQQGAESSQQTEAAGQQKETAAPGAEQGNGAATSDASGNAPAGANASGPGQAQAGGGLASLVSPGGDKAGGNAAASGLGALGFGPGSIVGGAPMIGGFPNTLIPRQLGVEDALAYLDKVKRQFHDRLEVYNQFLEIMKNFKSHNIDTPGVITHVCELFKGHDNLILGFNTFLPPGFKIELPNHDIGPTVGGRPIITQNLTLQQQQALMQQQIAQQRLKTARGLAGGQAAGMGGGPQGAGRGGAGRGAKGSPLGSVGRGSPVGSQMGGIMGDPTAGLSAFVAHNSVPMGMVEDTAAQAGLDGQPVEFDHAINYVTKIKKRFSSETDTYKTFLDILHSYQNEQRSIKEVLEQVSNLFKDHSDLLKEFTYFLPDAVRESAKTELVKRAAKAKARDRRLAKANAALLAGSSKRKGGGAGVDDEDARLPQLERNLLGRIKAALGTRELWGEFLKCLDLFAQELISRAELLALISDIFGERADLLEEFDRLLASRGATDDPVESAWFSMPLTDIDFANCRRCTPSYRALPAAYPKAPCSERTAMCRSVLNDTWVSVPLGSEDSNGKGSRRNQYQEMLFKCEDDRYEVDMIIDSNKSAIRALEPLAREIEALNASSGPGSKFRYRLEKRTLSVIHLKAIARIYGEHGTEVLELLRRNPAGAIPVILRRLKEKDDEWCRDRHELNKGWKEVMERNYSKSLDHRSFYFKQSEKRSFTQKVLLAEIREKKDRQDMVAASAAASAPSSEAPGTAGEAAKDGKNSPTATAAKKDKFTGDHLVVDFPDAALHQNVWGLIALKVSKTADAAEAEKIAAFFTYVVHPLFRMPDNWLAQGASPMQSLNANNVFDPKRSPRSKEDAMPNGTKVSTPYGPGIVQGYEPESELYKVALDFGMSSVGAAMVKPLVSGRGTAAKIAAMRPSRPIGMSDAKADEAVTAPTQPDGKTPQELFTTAAIYVLMRQYHILYERLLHAKNLCRSSNRQPKRVKHVLDRAHEEAEASALDAASRKCAQNADAMEVDSQGTSGPEPEDGSTAYTRLLALLYAHVNGNVDTIKFEDECRNLVGPDGFLLFTIDRVVTAIQKQLSTVVADTKSSECVQAIQSYLGKDSPMSADLSKIYETFNNHVLMQPEGTCLRMRFFPGVPKTPAQIEAENKEPEASPLVVPSGSIVRPRKKIPNQWSEAPRLAFTLTDKLPILELLGTQGSKAGTIPSPCPVSVNFTKTLNMEAVQELANDTLKSGSVQPAAAPAPGKNTGPANADGTSPSAPAGSLSMIDLPVYKFVQLPASEDVEQVIKSFANAKADGTGSDGNEISASLLISHVAAVAAKDSEPTNGVVAPQQDTEMKDA